MGYTSCQNWIEKNDIVRERTRNQESDTEIWRCLKHRCVGSVLWTVWEVTEITTLNARRFIGCDLLSKHDGCWGYRDMSEKMGPYYYSCPLGYLDLVPVADPTWRKRVRAWHTIQNHQVTVGDTYKANANTNCKGTTFTITSLKPLAGRDPFGNLYRLHLKHLDLGLPTPESILTPEAQAEKDILDAGGALRCSASTASDDPAMVHVLFRRKDGTTEGWLMHQDTYHAIPLHTPTTPADYQKVGPCRPAPDAYKSGNTTKQVDPAEFLQHLGIPALVIPCADPVPTTSEPQPA